MKTMTSDRKILLIVALVTLVLLLPSVLIPVGYIRITAAALLSIAAIAVCVLIKKRSIHSFHKRQVLLLLAVIAAVYLMLYYLSGVYFGFYSNYPLFSVSTLIRYILPGAVIIIATEIIRAVLLAQKALHISVLAYLICIVSDLLLGDGVTLIGEMHRFLDIVALSFLPAITSNLLYHYISKRYGAAPNIVYRLILTLTASFLPFVPAMPEAIESLSLLLLPLAVWLFIDLLYEKKFRYATKRTSKWTYVGVGAIVVVMISVVMLITCQFRFGLLVIATDSMHGELEIGDAVLFEACESDEIRKGDVIVFTKDSDTRIVHRVVDIQKINGQLQYYTKGDANEDADYGFITSDQVKGVVHFKIPLIGYPSLWLRSLFGVS